MNLIGVQLLNIKLLCLRSIVLISLHMKLIFQSIQFILLLLPISHSCTIWKLLGVYLIQKVSIVSLEVSASLLIYSSRMRTDTLTIFSIWVHIVLIYQCRILSAIKTHSIMLVSNWRQTSHQCFVLRHNIVNCLIY